MTRDRRPTWRAGVLLPATLAVALVPAVGCSSTAPPEPQPQVSFALTSADVAIAPDDAFPVNLVFVAPDDDPIWEKLRGVAVVGGPDLGPGEFNVERGEPLAEGVLGNLTFSVPIDGSGVEFEHVDLLLESQDEAVRVEVGSWRIEAETDSDASLTPVGDVVLTADACGPMSASFRNDTADTITAARATVEAPGAEITSAAIAEEAAPGDQLELNLELTCDATADFYILSPTVTYETAQGAITSRLEPVTIGLTAIDADTVDRIAARSA